MSEAPTARPTTPGTTAVLVAVAVGAAVSVVLGVYGRVHEPTGFAINLAGFSGPLYVKAWLTTVAFVLALVQLATALAMWGRLGEAAAAKSWTAPVHRWSGRLAVLVTVPVVVHCLYALGFEASSPRVLVHSLVGCLFYGAFVAKMLLLSRDGAPSWSMPVFGGLVFTGLTVLFLTSSVWVFATKGVKF